MGIKQELFIELNELAKNPNKSTFKKITENLGATEVNKVYEGDWCGLEKAFGATGVVHVGLFQFSNKTRIIQTSAVQNIIKLNENTYHLETCNSVYELVFLGEV